MGSLFDGNNLNNVIVLEGLSIRVTSYIRSQKCGKKMLTQSVVCLWVDGEVSAEQDVLLKKRVKELVAQGHEVNLFHSGKQSLIEQTAELLQHNL